MNCSRDRLVRVVGVNENDTPRFPAKARFSIDRVIRGGTPFPCMKAISGGHIYVSRDIGPCRKSVIYSIQHRFPFSFQLAMMPGEKKWSYWQNIW